MTFFLKESAKNTGHYRWNRWLTPGGLPNVPADPAEDAESQIVAWEKWPLHRPYSDLFSYEETAHHQPEEESWASTLRRAGVPHFPIYHLRHTFATRLSAGGVADHFVTQMLRQGDSAVFKRYSQAKLNMMREALQRLDRKANEHVESFGTVKPN